MLRYWKIYNPARSFFFASMATVMLFIVGRNIPPQMVAATFFSVFFMFFGLHALNWLFDIDLMVPEKKGRRVARRKLAIAAIIPMAASFLIIANFLPLLPFVVLLGNVLAIFVYGHMQHKYPVISIVKAYLAASAILFATAVAGINRLFIVPALMVMLLAFVHNLLKGISFGLAPKYVHYTFANLYGPRVVGIMAAGAILVLLIVSLFPVAYYPRMYLYIMGIADIFFAYVAYRMIIDPKKYAPESKWFLIAGGVFAAAAFAIPTYFVL